RDRNLASEAGAVGVDLIRVGPMRTDEALQVLGVDGEDTAESDTARTLIERVGGLALALRILRGQHDDGLTWVQMLEDLDHHRGLVMDVEPLQTDTAEREARTNLIASIYLSVRTLDAAGQLHLAWLGVLRDERPVLPLATATLWDTDPRSARDF